MNSETIATTVSTTGQGGHRQAHPAPKTDAVTLSDGARSLAAARYAVQQAPDVRYAKLTDIKQRVQNGTYSVPARALARKMVDALKDPS
jgi:flagellar biosynthesis anti-sigma factor FlgM